MVYIALFIDLFWTLNISLYVWAVTCIFFLFIKMNEDMKSTCSMKNSCGIEQNQFGKGKYTYDSPTRGAKLSQS